MRVLLLNDYGTPTGGPDWQMFAIRRGLRARGHQARLLTSSVGVAPERAPSDPGDAIRPDATCFGTRSSLQKLTQAANPFAWQAVRKELADHPPDVVHVRMFLYQLSPLVLSLFADVPVVYQAATYKTICPKGTKVLPDGAPCAHPPGRVCHSEGCLTARSWPLFMAQLALLARGSGHIDRIVAISRQMKDRLEAEGIPRVHVIPNGVRERPARPPLREPPTVAYAGRLVPEKGVEELLRAVALLRRSVPGLRLLVLGDGPQRRELEALADRLGLVDAVEFRGRLGRDAMEETLDRAWVQAVPSRWAEPFGNVATEAMMRGTAVLASRTGGLAEIVLDGETGILVPAGAVEPLAEALRSIVTDRQLAERMGRRGRKRALAEYSEDLCVERFIRLYESIRPHVDVDRGDAR